MVKDSNSRYIMYDYLWIIGGLFLLSILNLTYIIQGGISNWTTDFFSTLSPLSWILAILLLFLPLLYLMLTCLRRGFSLVNRRTFFVLFFIAIISMVTIRILPILMGAFTFGYGDTITHFGYIVDILNSGHFTTINPYPGMHTQISTYSLITGVYLVDVSNYLLGIYLFLTISGFYLLSCKLFSDNSIYFYSVLALLPLLPIGMISERLIPNSFICLSFIFCTYLVFCYLSNNVFNKRYAIPFLFFAIFGWWYHPEFAVYSLIFFVTVFAVIFISPKLSSKVPEYNVSMRKMIFCLIVILLGFVFLFIQTTSFSYQFSQMLHLISFTQTDNTQMSTIGSALTKFSMSEFILRLVLKYVYIIVPVLSCAYIIYSFKLFIQKLNQPYIKLKLITISCFIALCLFSCANIVVGTTIGTSIFRMFQYPVLISVFLLAFYLVEIVLVKPKSNLKKILTFIFIIGIIIVPIISACSSYGSHYFDKSNQNMVTDAGVTSNKLFFDVRNDAYKISESFLHPYQSRYPQYYYGLTAAYGLENIGNLNSVEQVESLKPKNHFGYDEYNTVTNADLYAPYYYINVPWCSNYTTFFGGVYQLSTLEFDDIDFYHLDYDDAVQKLIDGGYDYSIYLIS